ncbi:MAG: DNA/RNA nuclease SfsA [Deltaproteobacteria bacterium]|nr:MAG: DNA/RNA nuclease SfsA [Deltaproteobacteria bacterium]
MPALTEATLLRRYKRFLADIRLDDGTEITAHCPNPGRMTACWAPGARCRVSHSDDPRRKLAYTLEQVRMDDGWVLVHTGRPNAVVADALARHAIPEIRAERVTPEQRAVDGGSRFDFRVEEQGSDRITWVEVKNLTLVDGDGVGRFPDAVTARGAKHALELAERAEAGDRAVLLFHVGRPGPTVVAPADDVDPNYGRAIREAVARGVEVLAYRGHVGATELSLGERLVVDLTSPGR